MLYETLGADDPLRHARLSQTLAGLLAVSIALTTLLRPLVVELDPIFTKLGWFNAGLNLLVYLLIASRRIDAYAAGLLSVSCLVCLLPLLWISGGVNSQYAPLVPLYPVSAAFFAGRNISLALAAFLSALIVYGFVVGLPIVDLTGDDVASAKADSRAVWLLITTVIGTYFAYQFDRSLRALRGRLWEQANVDTLTGIANRRALDRHFDDEISRSERTLQALSVLIIDVDFFKRVNDQRGHAAGDQCLVDIAKKLGATSRRGQDFVGRFGGEEFVALLGNTSQEQAAHVGDDIREEVAALAIPYGTDLSDCVTVTIGCASSVPGRGDTAESLLQRADRALYAGKESGRNRVVSAQ